MDRVIVIMTAAGVLGGIVNLALNEPSRKDWYWSIIAGIGASLLIPLFLRTVSSELLSNVLKLPSGTLSEDHLVLFSFSLLAALSSRAFIQSLTDNVLKNLTQGQENLKVRQRELEGKVNDADQFAKEIAIKSDDVALIAETAARGGVGVEPARSMVRARSFEMEEIARGNVPDDPWKGAFGGKSEDNGRRLEATIAPMASRDGVCRVELRVLSVAPGKPLSGEVTFFLHPTFKNDQVVVKVDEERHIAKLTLAAWGAFTVGALADNGYTKLELDLADDPNAPVWFKEA